MVQNCGLHRVWLERDSPITHITFNPKNPSHILLHDIYMFCVLDKSLVSPRAGSGRLGLCPGHLPCPAPRGVEGAVHGAEVVVVVPGSTDVLCPLLAAPARQQCPPDEPEHPEAAPGDCQAAAAPRLQDLQEVPGG